MKKVAIHEHIFAGIPFILVVVGGAIGGGLGGVAYFISVSIFKKDMPTPLKYLLSLLVSITAFIVYLAIVFAITGAFPDLFQK